MAGTGTCGLWAGRDRAGRHTRALCVALSASSEQKAPQPPVQEVDLLLLAPLKSDLHSCLAAPKSQITETSVCACVCGDQKKQSRREFGTDDRIKGQN